MFDAEVRTDIGGIVETFINGVPLTTIRVGICQKRRSCLLMKIELSKSSIHDLLTKLLIAFLVEFFENYRAWLDKTVQANTPAEWPNVWQFARVVRNAAAHNTVNITNPNFKPVSWYSLTYGLEQNGRVILGPDLAPADIIILIIEMDEALTALGAPISLFTDLSGSSPRDRTSMRVFR